MTTRLLPYAASLFILTGCCDFEEVIPTEKTPVEIRNFVDTHFPELEIRRCEKDCEGFSPHYQVDLRGDIHLEFNHKFRILELDAETRLPDSVIPEKIRMYVEERFSGSSISDWKRNDCGHQEVKLTNGTALEFSDSDEFLKRIN